MEGEPHWLITADSRGAQLFGCQRLSSGRLHVDQIIALRNTHENEHEHHRPTLGRGAERRGSIMRSGARAAPSSVAPGHTTEEETERFAREVGHWIGRLRGERGARPALVFAPPRFLGLLRKHVQPEEGTVMHEGDLAHMSTPELSVHPAVVRAMTAASSTRL